MGNTDRPEVLKEAELAGRINEIIAEYWADAESETQDAALRRLAKAFAQTEAALRATDHRPDVGGLREVIEDIDSRLAKLNPGSDGFSMAKRRQVIKWATVHLTAIRDQLAALATTDKATREPAGLTQADMARLLHRAHVGCIEGSGRCDPDGDELSLWHYEPADRLRAALAEPAPDDALRTAGMRALRGYHMAHYRDTLPAGKHDHPVERCEAEPFVSIFRALAPEPPEAGR